MSSTETRSLTRRGILGAALLGGGMAALGACLPKVQVKFVENEVTKTVKEVVTATPAPRGPVTIRGTAYYNVKVWESIAPRAKQLGLELDISFTPVAGGHDQYANTVMTRLAGGEQLDLVFVATAGLGPLAAANILRPLEPFFEADKAAHDDIKNDIHPMLLKSLQFKGKQLNIPLEWNPTVMYYNTAVFQDKGVAPPKPDWTWEDFLEICLRVASVKGGKDDLYAYAWLDGAWPMMAWYYNNDTSFLNPEWTDSNLLDPKVAETLQFLVDLIHKHKVAPQLAGFNLDAQFGAGNVAMRTCGRWCVAIARNYGLQTYEITYQPHRRGPYRASFGSAGFGVTTLCRYPQEAWQALKLVTDKEANLAMVSVAGSTPARRSAAESPQVLNEGPSKNLTIFYKVLDQANITPSPSNVNIIEPLLRRYYAQIWAGELTVGKALPQMHKELQAEMDKLKKTT